MENFTPLSASLGGALIGLSAVWLMASRPELLRADFPITGPLLIIGGICVGIGTQLGSGCTSGHGVCGNARLSLRSLLATLTFMITGILTVLIMRILGGG